MGGFSLTLMGFGLGPYTQEERELMGIQFTLSERALLVNHVSAVLRLENHGDSTELVALI